jgi:hypothetical protein
MRKLEKIGRKRTKRTCIVSVNEKMIVKIIRMKSFGLAFQFSVVLLNSTRTNVCELLCQSAKTHNIIRVKGSRVHIQVFMPHNMKTI